MRMIALTAAGLVAAAAMTPTPAEAQRYGYGYGNGGYYGGWNDGYRRDRRWRDHRGWRDGRGWRGDRGWRGHRAWRGRDRVRCVWVRGYYGPQRQCFRR